MKVEVFSDVVCPWCAIGKRRLESALEEFEHGDEVEVVWRSYELAPDAPRVVEGDYLERLATKYGMTRAGALAATEHLTRVGADEGLAFHFETARPGNTFDAHRLLHHARTFGPRVAGALKERFMVAYFTEAEPIGEVDTLTRLAAEVGLDREECREILAGDRYGADVRAEERQALELGVSGVPFFVIDGRFAIAGAQDASVIRGALERARRRANLLDLGPGETQPDGGSSPERCRV